MLYNITSVEYNTLLDFQIPIVQEIIHDYCNADFISTSLEKAFLSNGISKYETPNIYAYGFFTIDSSTKTITSSYDSFDNFVVGDNIVIKNSNRNDGYFTIAAVTSTVITVEEEIIDADEYIDIYLVIYSKSVKNIAALMVGYDIFKRPKTQGIESEHIGTYSVKYKSINGSSYPIDIVAGLKKYHSGK